LSFKSQTSLHILLLVCACYFLFFFKMGARDLWSPDEPRYAQVAREMLETGDWVVPHLNGDVYLEKPPLYFWLIALAAKPFGDVTEAAARFPSALAAALVVLLTYFLGAKTLGRQEAFLGAVVMATSAQFFRIGRIGALDSLLTLCILAALGTFYIAYAKKLPLLYVPGFLFLAPAVLTKGPVGIAVPLVVMFSFLIVEILLGKEGGKKHLLYFAAATIVGLVLVVLIVAPWWQAAVERSGGAYGSKSILLKQTMGRMARSYSHQRPFHYYFGEIFWQFLPWTVFLPLTVHAIWKKGDLRESVGLRFLVVWFLSVFLFFTCISGKRTQYLLPLFPAAGLLIGWALTVLHPAEGRLRERREFWIPLLALVLLAFGGLVAIVVGAYLHPAVELSVVLTAVFASVVGLSILVRQCLGRSPRTALGCVAVVTILVVVVAVGYAGPAVDKYRSARPFCNNVLAAMEDDDELFFYRVYRNNIHYYMHRRIPWLHSEEDVVTALGSSPRIFLILQWQNKGTLDSGATRFSYETEQVVRAKIGSRDMLCVMVRPNEAPQ